jgi:hypothetical protein
MWPIPHIGSSESKSAVAFTESYGEFQRAALEHEPPYQVQGALIDGFDSTTKGMRTLFPGARLGDCLRHALNKLPDKLVGLTAPVRKGLRSKFHTLLHRWVVQHYAACRCGRTWLHRSVS